MKRHAQGLCTTLLLPCATLACAPPPPSAPAPVELKVLSYNLRHDVDFYQERMELMADGIAALAPDVIGLQEVEIGVEQGEILNDMIRERDAALDYELRQVLKHGAAAVTGEGVAIMSRFPVDDVDWLEMSDGRVSLFGRVLVDEEQALAVDLCTTHLTSDGGDDGRAEQAAATLAFLDEQRRHTRVLVGDFNADGDDPAVTTVREAGLEDTYLFVHGAEETAASGNTSPVVLGVDNPAQDFRRRIDYVFAGEEDAALEILASDVVMDEPRADGLYPSDHLGVMTTLRLTPPLPE